VHKSSGITILHPRDRLLYFCLGLGQQALRMLPSLKSLLRLVSSLFPDAFHQFPVNPRYSRFPS
jgi:hypothetical protein